MGKEKMFKILGFRFLYTTGKTEKIYWVTGHQIRGEFNSFNFKNGLMICFDFGNKYFSISKFKLV